MTDLTHVREGKIEVGYWIRQYGERFDWIAGQGEDSDQLFDTADEAEADVRSRYGG